MADNSKIIWDFLKSKGFNDYAAAGILGNLEAESNLNSKNLQDTSNRSLNMTDDQYTIKVDNGTYTNFVKDSAGYGICQWTFWSRKQALLNYAQKTKRSIGNLTMQLEFLLIELEEQNLIAKLKKANSVQEASTIFMIQFEKPKNQTTSAQAYRTGLSMNYYNKYFNSSNISTSSSNSSSQTKINSLSGFSLLRKGDNGVNVISLQKALISLGYSCGPDGADGDFGNSTEQAVIRFQRDNDLETDGIVGNQTIQVINYQLNGDISAIMAHFAKSAQSSTSQSQNNNINSNSKYTAQNLIEIAKSQLGYREKASNLNLDDNTANAGSGNWTKYARDLAHAGYYNGNKNGYAWCDVFVDWCFYQLTNRNAKKAQDLECQTGDLGAGCIYSAQYYRQQGRFSSTPQLGDQIFFGTTGNEYHTGIVIGITNTTITTIEGNSSDQVASRTYPRSYASISGFGHPKYDTSTSTANITTAENNDKMLNIAGIVTVGALNVRQGPGTNYPVVSVLQKGATVIIVEISNNWGKTNLGWVSLDYIQQAQ